MAQRHVSRQQTTRTKFATESDTSRATSNARYDKVAIRGFSQSVGVIPDANPGWSVCVYSIAVSPSGNYLATASEEGLRVWKMEQKIDRRMRPDDDEGQRNSPHNLKWGYCTEISLSDATKGFQKAHLKKSGLKNQHGIRRREVRLQTVAFGGGRDGSTCWIFGTQDKLDSIKAWSWMKPHLSSASNTG